MDVSEAKLVEFPWRSEVFQLAWDTDSYVWRNLRYYIKEEAGMWKDHAVDERHEAKLKTMLRLQVGPELPTKVLTKYWLRKGLMDKMGAIMTDSDLVQIAIECGATEKDEPASFLQNLPVDRDTPVIVKWRGEDVGGWYKGLRGKKIVVVLDDESAEEREINPEFVHLANGK